MTVLDKSGMGPLAPLPDRWCRIRFFQVPTTRSVRGTKTQELEDKDEVRTNCVWHSAAYGLVSLVPSYFLLDKVGHDAPPPLTHPEFYYGFLGVTFLWQLVFVLMAKDPLRYRSLMPIAILEKFVYTVPVVVLYTAGRVHPNIMRPALVDPIFGLLFIVVYFRTATATTSRAREHASTLR
jgi:hypothetical protein